ncbi:primosomal protein N' [Salimicrobium jeotgali]|uniref:primosomal protein N' n=1 Tax=Salimicrobium jeotgali TaxID=1230341 RepID=UPI000C85263F|nr:primosomal protein N' [Salimicrobium jeotgali]
MIAKVIVDVPTNQTNRPFDYLIPEEFTHVIDIGMRVIVPFGPRKILGYVVGFEERTDVEKVKSLEEVLDVTPVLTPELLRLGKWLASRTLSFYISCLQVMLPQVLKAKYKKEIWRVEEHLPEELETLFQGKDVLTSEEWEASSFKYHHLKKWVDDGYLDVRYEVKSKETKRKITVIEPGADPVRLEELIAEIPAQAKKQRALIDFFVDYPDPIPKKDLLNFVKTTDASLNPLLKKGYLQSYSQEILRDPYEGHTFESTSSPPLTRYQQQAMDEIVDSVKNEKPDVYLLHGVTGSGKTEVYMQSIQEVLARGEEAIMLVPEIALTPQMVERFKGRFGSKVAVLHSALSAGEKYDEWRKIQRRDVQVVVGARSAIFAPFRNLGLIIIDEEHETSYKQEDRTRYHARDVALKRASEHGCPVVLGSATPSLESFARAQKGNYRLLELPERMNEQAMPTVELVDMREELHEGNRSMFSQSLKAKLEERLQKGEQSVLFLNRRGYSTFVMCRDCGHVVECPYCDISMTYHRNQERLKCHYCSFEQPMPSKCPECESKTIRYFGTGTQKVEEHLQQLIPEARIIRMDVDTTRRKGAHEKLLTKFGNNEADILLGTQMIAKGLDFGNVTLVGVLAADSLLNLPDFRASEKTFQLLTQVSGRAGRHEKEGEVVVQTYTPDHYSIQLASTYDFNRFYEEEMKYRKMFHYPPFYYLTLLTVSHPNTFQAQEVTRKIAQYLKQNLSETAEVLGPTPSPLERINNRYRYQTMVKYKSEPDQQKYVQRIMNYYESEMKEQNGLQIIVDFQPYQLM